MKRSGNPAAQSDRRNVSDGLRRSVLGDKVGVRCVRCVALAECMSKLVFGNVHYVSGDWSYGDARPRTTASVLMFLILGFPTPFQFETSLLPLKDDMSQCGHLMAFHLAAHDEFRSAGKQGCDNEEGYRFGILFEPMQQ
jgi:hypothetical protein